jgi:hypothetical protein
MKAYYCLLLLLPQFSFSQQKFGNNNIDSVVNKWTRSIVNIECQYWAIDMRDSIMKLIGQPGQNDSTVADKLQDIDLVFRSAGTAIFLKEKGEYFLLSNRHMLIDPTDGKQHLPMAIYLTESTGTIHDRKNERIDNSGNIFINAKEGITFMRFMPFGETNFGFSDPNQDLGILNISVGLRASFLEALLKHGYQPITLADIDTSWRVKIGDPVIAIGYPQESRILNKALYFPKRILQYEASFITRPIITKGVVSALKASNPNFFECEIFTYHGMSGGPILKNGKLIGIVQGFIPEELKLRDSINSSAMYMHPTFVKASLIIPLLRAVQNQ